MLTNVLDHRRFAPHSNADESAPTTTAQKVVIVNGSAEMLELLETVARRRPLRRRRSSSRVSMHIRRSSAFSRTSSSCASRIEDADGFQVLYRC